MTAPSCPLLPPPPRAMPPSAIAADSAPPLFSLPTTTTVTIFLTSYHCQRQPRRNPPPPPMKHRQGCRRSAPRRRHRHHLPLLPPRAASFGATIARPLPLHTPPLSPSPPMPPPRWRTPSIRRRHEAARRRWLQQPPSPLGGSSCTLGVRVCPQGLRESPQASPKLNGRPPLKAFPKARVCSRTCFQYPNLEASELIMQEGNRKVMELCLLSPWSSQGDAAVYEYEGDTLASRCDRNVAAGPHSSHRPPPRGPLGQ